MHTEKHYFNIFYGMMVITAVCLITTVSLSVMTEGWLAALFNLAGVCFVAGAIYTPLGYHLFKETNFSTARNIGRFGFIMLVVASLLFSIFWPPLVYLNAIVGAIIIASTQLAGGGIWVKYTSWAHDYFPLVMGITLMLGSIFCQSFF